MPVSGRPIDPWEIGHYVLGYDGEPIGPIDVGGLSGVLDAIEDLRAHRTTRFPELDIAGLDTQSQKWLQGWAQTVQSGGEKRDLIIRDNRHDRWIAIRGAFVRVFGDRNVHPVVITRAELVDGPET
jgi:hypothetical protein